MKPEKPEKPVEPPPAPDPAPAPVVPTFDVTNCIVCGRPMEHRSCKYRCPTCKTMIDCSDPY